MPGRQLTVQEKNRIHDFLVHYEYVCSCVGSTDYPAAIAVEIELIKAVQEMVDNG